MGAIVMWRSECMACMRVGGPSDEYESCLSMGVSGIVQD